MEVMNQIFIPGQTTWTQLAGVCDRAGFTDLATALLDSYTTGEITILSIYFQRFWSPRGYHHQEEADMVMCPLR